MVGKVMMVGRGVEHHLYHESEWSGFKNVSINVVNWQNWGILRPCQNILFVISVLLFLLFVCVLLQFEWQVRNEGCSEIRERQAYAHTRFPTRQYHLVNNHNINLSMCENNIQHIGSVFLVQLCFDLIAFASPLFEPIVHLSNHCPPKFQILIKNIAKIIVYLMLKLKSMTIKLGQT